METRIKSLVAVAVVGAVLMMVARCMMQPRVYPGDRVETRDCRWCGGTGKDAPSEEGMPQEGMQAPGVPPGVCPGCRGAKKLTVIVPGPKHPAEVKGTVRDEEVAGAMDAALPEEQAMMEFEESHNPTQAVRGGIGNATIKLEGPDNLELHSSGGGRFKALLTPGDYKVTVSAPGFATTTTSLHVEPRREPIWQERAHLVTEESMQDVTVATFTLRK